MRLKCSVRPVDFYSFEIIISGEINFAFRISRFIYTQLKAENRLKYEIKLKIIDHLQQTIVLDPYFVWEEE